MLMLKRKCITMLNINLFYLILTIKCICDYIKIIIYLIDSIEKYLINDTNYLSLNNELIN